MVIKVLSAVQSALLTSLPVQKFPAVLVHAYDQYTLIVLPRPSLGVFVSPEQQLSRIFVALNLVLAPYDG